MGNKTKSTGTGTGSPTKAPEVNSLLPSMNHKLIKALSAAEQGLDFCTLSEAAGVSINEVKAHIFTLRVLGIVSFDEGSLYQLTAAGRQLAEDIGL